MGQQVIMKMNVAVIVPTYQGGAVWADWLAAFQQQSITVTRVIVVDSSSTDGTVDHSRRVGLEPVIISSKDFNHGGTRNMSANLALDADVLVFLTQDAILATPESIAHILSPFCDPSVAAVCGRQLPHNDANPLATHARNFNYPECSHIKSLTDINAVGLKVAFMSNSFAAYRKAAFDAVGGFPDNTILAEDMYVAAKMILAGYKVAYCADATVRHSHNYTPWAEFRRYFDTGVFHANEPWIQEQLGGAYGEGLKFVKSEFLYLLKNAPLWIPRALLTTVFKLFGYKLGRNYKSIPKDWRPKLSMYKSYWLQHNNNK